MSRSSYKIKFFTNSIYRLKKKVLKMKKLKKKNPKISNKPKYIYSRQSSIPQYLVDEYVWIHSGLTFTKIKIVEGMLGLKFGDLVYTKKRGPEIHDKKKKK